MNQPSTPTRDPWWALPLSLGLAVLLIVLAGVFVRDQPIRVCPALDGDAAVVEPLDAPDAR